MPRLVVLFAAAAAAVVPNLASAADASPEVNAAVRRGVAFIKKSLPKNPKTGEAVLGAMALVKAGEPVDGAEIQAVLAAVQQRSAGTDYKPDTHHYYTAGLELMFLESIDPDRYRPEMEKILAWILKGQRTSGAWYYPNQPEGTGDTSITQYAALGLWAADRSGLTVPREAWDRMAAWHIRTQLRDGGFAYHPDEPSWANRALPAITLGGAANLLLARLHMFRTAELAGQSRPSPREGTTGKRFGVLETVQVDATADKQSPDAADRRYSPKSSPDAIGRSVDAAVAWSATNFRLPPDTTWQLYYLYGLERMAALGDMATLGEHDWYQEGSAWLIETQGEDGSWNNSGGAVPGTAFGILFLTKSTSKMLGRTYGVPELGGGLLAGGRGLPDDLGSVNVAGGNVGSRQAGGPLDELLARLEDAKAANVPEVQAAVLEAIRFGDREALIGQRDRLLRLVDDPRPDIRRTAFWALGRGGELADVPLLIQGLSDTDAAVAIEAHNALCVLSRRPLAFDLPGDPFAGLLEDAADADRQQALSAWRDQAVAAWTQWYRRVAPYEERDGLGLFR